MPGGCGQSRCNRRRCKRRKRPIPALWRIAAAMLFGLSVPKFQKCFSILLETAPKNIKISKMLKNIPFVSKPEVKIFVAGDEKGNILTMKCQVESSEDKGKLMTKLKNRMKNKINDSTIEIITV